MEWAMGCLSTAAPQYSAPVHSSISGDRGCNPSLNYIKKCINNRKYKPITIEEQNYRLVLCVYLRSLIIIAKC